MKVPTIKPYIPNKKDVQFAIVDGEVVMSEELDTVSEFMDDYDDNLDYQLGLANRIMPIRMLLKA